mmetsp:Transcript_112159/g.176561  ORF Transcript_112159/g.176561 Transcript_112159/m.176561 type:complete len:180 (+) Transcript_112159:128-667(+)
MKFDTTGDWKLTQQRGSSKADVVGGLALDSAGEVWIAGSTGGALDGNADEGGNVAFLMRFSGNGVHQNTETYGTPSETVTGIVIDSSDNIHITGHTTSQQAGQQFFGESDIFVMKFDNSGTWQSTRQVGSPTGDRPWGIAIKATDKICITGHTSGTLLGEVPPSGSEEAFLMCSCEGGL